MRTFLVAGAAGLLITLANAPPAWSFNWKDIVQMHQDSISDELIIEKIQHSGKSFDLDAGDLRQLKEAGVSDRVISAMLRTEDQEEGDDGYGYGYGYYPYHGYYPGTRVYLDLGFGSGWYGGYSWLPYGYSYGVWGGRGFRYHGRGYGGYRHVGYGQIGYGHRGGNWSGGNWGGGGRWRGDGGRNIGGGGHRSGGGGHQNVRR